MGGAARRSTKNYHAITAGWAFDAGLTTAFEADSKKGKQCVLCGCGCKGGWKKDAHMCASSSQ